MRKFYWLLLLTQKWGVFLFLVFLCVAVINIARDHLGVFEWLFNVIVHIIGGAWLLIQAYKLLRKWTR